MESTCISFTFGLRYGQKGKSSSRRNGLHFALLFCSMKSQNHWNIYAQKLPDTDSFKPFFHQKDVAWSKINIFIWKIPFDSMLTINLNNLLFSIWERKYSLGENGRNLKGERKQNPEKEDGKVNTRAAKVALEIYSKRAFVWEPLREARKVEAAGPGLHRHSEVQTQEHSERFQLSGSSHQTERPRSSRGFSCPVQEFHIITHSRFCCGKGITHTPHAAQCVSIGCLSSSPPMGSTSHWLWQQESITDNSLSPSALISLRQFNLKLSPPLLLE